MGFPRRAGVFAVVAALVLGPVAPGEAAPTVTAGTFIGSGTLSPGLTPLTGTPQSIAIAGSGAELFAGAGLGADAARVNCSFQGSSSGVFANETSGLGSGTLVGGCSGTTELGSAFVASCSLDYFRELAHLLSGGCTVSVGGATTTVSLAGVFMFTPTSGMPTQSFSMVALLAAASA